MVIGLVYSAVVILPQRGKAWILRYAMADDVEPAEVAQ
jgi:hypothetical protein